MAAVLTLWQLANPKGSTLEALFRKLQSLEEAQRGQLLGKIIWSLI
ncbi:hypothetical protein [Trichormus azollae]|mgnify:FL=1|jgi:hypothetical protein|nr:hypothetical protein [Trichormus azollae]